MTRPHQAPADLTSGPLQDLRRAVEALRPYLDQPDQQADLTLIDQAVERLTHPPQSSALGIADFDPSRLSHLLQITGRDLGPELLARLTEDLIATQDTLALGAEAADWKRLREGSHVLISLSGSVGAVSLQAMAENLNALAHHQDSEGVSSLMGPLDGELSALIRLIRATRAPT